MRRRKRLSRRRGVYMVLLLFAVIMAGSYLAAGGRRVPAPPVSPSLEQPGPARILDSTVIVLKQRFTQCEHEYTWLGGDLPEEFALINFTGLSRAELEAVLPGSWHLLEFSPQQVVLEQVGEICRTCPDKRYIGIHNNMIAIFRGVPPAGSLERVTEFEVKDDVRDQLEKGIPFSTIEELIQILESYTS